MADAKEARAHARAICAEMHAGFRDLRDHCAMDLLARRPLTSLPQPVAANVRRIIELWTASRRRFGSVGNFLFGAFTAADAMYAPVATRFRTYLPDLTPYGDDGTAQAYLEAVFALPGMARWEEGARREAATGRRASIRQADRAPFGLVRLRRLLTAGRDAEPGRANRRAVAEATSMTSIPSSPIAALSQLTSVGIAGVASASLLAACAGSPLPTLASGDGRLMAGPDAAETRAEPTAKGASSIGQDRRQKSAQRRSGPQLRPPAAGHAGDKQQAASLHAGHYGILSSTVILLLSSSRSS